MRSLNPMVQSFEVKKILTFENLETFSLKNTPKDAKVLPRLKYKIVFSPSLNKNFVYVPGSQQIFL